MKEDQKLYKDFLGGNEKSFEELISKYKSNLIYFITRYVKNMEIAEDIFQEVMVYILENKEQYKFEYSFKTYMYMIAKSRAINYVKKDKNIESIEEIKTEIEDTKLLEEIICSDERKQKIQKVIDKLQEEYQLVIYLTQIEGLSYKEVAQIMGKTDKQIKTLLHNSRKKLKKLLLDENIIEIRNKRIIVLVSSILFIIAMTTGIVTGITYADEITKIIKELFGPNLSDGVDTAVENGYVSRENVESQNLEIQNAEGFAISVESFMIDDYNFGINFNVKIDEKLGVTELKKFKIEDLNIYDENNKTIFNIDSVKFKKEEVLERRFKGGYGFSYGIKDDKNILISLAATQEYETFPRSKKMFIEFTELVGNFGKDGIEEKCFKGDWKFEIDVPEEMYNRTNIIYKVKSCNDDKTIVENAILSNTAFKISIPETTTDKIDYKALYDRKNMKSIYSLIALQKEYVETSDGKKFEISSDGNNGYGSSADNKEKIIDYHQTFNLTKFDATDELTVHIFTNTGEEIIIEYEKAK